MNFLKKEVTFKRTYLGVIIEGIIEALALTFIFYVLFTSPDLREAMVIAQKVDMKQAALLVFPVILICCLCSEIGRALIFGNTEPSKKKKGK